jgi:UDP-N-acetylmuramyl pentapeptide phosphotransferase/UDP-N-acetylglucosamine-1-phosphate transferase
MLYLLVFALLIIAQLVYFRLADRFNIIDKPNDRSSHTKITLRGGGIVFYMGVLFYFLLCEFQYPGLFAGLTLITLISFADDIKPQSSKLRLSVHFVAMFLMFNQLGLYQTPWYFTLMALVFCTGVLNAYNFMDGINGITGVYSMVVVGALWYINTYQVAFVDNDLIYFLLMALLVFNFFNFRTKAKCFAGDVGAISIAFVIVFMLCLLILKTKDISYILLLGLYGVDSILTIIHRILLKENIFRPHRKHAFQLMANELKIPHVWVSSIYMLIQALISAGLIMTTYHYEYAILVISMFCGIYVLFMKKYFKLHRYTDQ